jgi:ribonuclease P protein component
VLSFGPKSRLSGRTEFRRVFESGRKFVGRSVIVWCLDLRSSAPPRLGLSVSAKAGAAVRRSRLKRLTRETFRLNAARLAPGHDVVVYFRKGCRWEGLADAQDELTRLWTKAGLIK